MALTTDLKAYYNGEESVAVQDLSDSVAGQLLDEDFEPAVSSDSPDGAGGSRDLETDSNQYFWAATAGKTLFKYATTSFSFSIWVKLESLTNHRYVLSRLDNFDYTNLAEYFLMARSDGQVRWLVKCDDGTLYEVNSTVTISTGTWHHITCGFVSNGGSSYIWIAVDNETKVTTASDDTIRTNNTVYFTLGAVYPYTHDTATTYDGKLCRFGVWERELTQSEITELYNSGDGLRYPFTSGGDGYNGSLGPGGRSKIYQLPFYGGF